MPAYLSPIGNEQQNDANGAPLSGGFIYTYQAGSTTPVVTYTDQAGTIPQANPIVLNASGLPAQPIWLPASQAVKLVIQNAQGVVQRTVDNVLGVNDPSGVATQSEWTQFSGVPTFLSATTFSLAGDQTNIFQVKRRLRSVTTGGTVYSTVTASSYNAGTGLTTVTVSNTSGVLDAGLSQVSYGLLTAVNGSVPLQSGQLIGRQVFTANGTYTPTFGTSSVVVEVQGGGGGSGGCAATAAGQAAIGVGGAGGGYGSKRITSGFSGVTVTVGAGGAAGAAGNNAGGTGGTSSFGALLSCTGGAGGSGGDAASIPSVRPTSAFPAGGAPTGHDFGAVGGAPEHCSSVSNVGIAGSGGDSFMGKGAPGAGVFSNNTAAISPVSPSYGGGARGPANVNGTFAAAAGAVGAPGVVIVWEYA